jgi:hypothetical protein
VRARQREAIATRQSCERLRAVWRVLERTQLRRKASERRLLRYHDRPKSRTSEVSRCGNQIMSTLQVCVPKGACVPRIVRAFRSLSALW